MSGEDYKKAIWADNLPAKALLGSDGYEAYRRKQYDQWLGLGCSPEEAEQYADLACRTFYNYLLHEIEREARELQP